MEFTNHLGDQRQECPGRANIYGRPEKRTDKLQFCTMASASFREQMNSLGWSRRADDEPVNTSQRGGLLSSIKSLNPFGDSGYVRLPTTEGAGAPLPAPTRREEEEGWFACESMLVSLGLSSSPIELRSGAKAPHLSSALHEAATSQRLEVNCFRSSIWCTKTMRKN